MKRLTDILIFFDISIFFVTIKSNSYPETFKILAIGGKYVNDHGNLTSDVELIDPFLENSHCGKPQNYPFPTSEITANGGIVCGGGFENQDYKCFQYSIQNKSWADGGILSAQRYAASSVSYSGNYWITGGGLLNGQTSLVTSDIRKGNSGPFVSSSDLPEQLRHHCMSVLNETHIFIAGGDWSPKSPYFVDISLNPFKFTKLPPMLENRSGAACGTVAWGFSSDSKTANFLVIVAGGTDYSSTTGTSTTSEFYSEMDGVWVNGPILPRGFVKGGYFSTKYYSLVMIGGQDENYKSRSDVMIMGNYMDAIGYLPGKLELPRIEFATMRIDSDEEC